MESSLNIFSEIKIENPVDVIIKQVRELISSGKLKPGDRLPSERSLSERIGLGRSHIREAIKKLEFYGIVKTLPQSGTTVTGIGITALKGMISDILKLEKSDFQSLVETRVILGIDSARLSATRRTEKDLVLINKALENFEKVALVGEPGIEEDFLFHLAIIDSARNPVIKSLFMLIVPQVIDHYNDKGICTQGESMKAYQEHLDIFQAIINKDAECAASLVKQHFSKILEMSRS